MRSPAAVPRNARDSNPLMAGVPRTLFAPRVDRRTPSLRGSVRTDGRSTGVDVGGDAVGMVVEPCDPPVRLRPSTAVEPGHRCEAELLAVVAVERSHFHNADAGRVVLQLVAARAIEGVGLFDD